MGSIFGEDAISFPEAYRGEIAQVLSRIQHRELSQRRSLTRLKSANAFARPKSLRVGGSKRLDHYKKV
jgi:hypothetical protein